MCSAQRERIRLEAGAALAADFKQRVDKLKEHQFESLRKTVRKLQETEDVMCANTDKSELKLYTECYTRKYTTTSTNITTNKQLAYII